MKKVKISASACLLEEPTSKEFLLLAKAHQRYQRARICVGSKAAVLVLFWSFVSSFVYILLLHKNTIATVLLSTYSPVFLLIAISVYAAIVQCFYPAAGYLADTKFGRYRVIYFSLWILLASLLCIGTAGVLAFFNEGTLTTHIMIGIVYFACLLHVIGAPGLDANVIQFGLDQLFLTPAEDQSLFIQWHVWEYFISAAIANVFLDSEIFTKYNNSIPLTLFAVPLCAITLALLVSLYIFHRKKNWFLIMTRYRNPYSLVYKVTKFSRLHKIPIKRSAFTYCEDEIPSGLDLGKEKYGGPFTIEEVEDVKAFYGVLKVIFSLSPVLFLHVAENHVLSLLSSHFVNNTDQNLEDLSVNYSTSNQTPFSQIIGNGTIYSVVGCILIPLSICLIRPLVRDYTPGMLRRTGIGITLSVLSMMTSLAADVMMHITNKDIGCMFSMPSNINATSSTTYSYAASIQSTAKALLILQQILSAFSRTIFYIAVYEFICSQSPHFMKGFLLGLFYATRGLSEVLASLLMLPFALHLYKELLPSCGTVYYIVNAVVGVAALVGFSWTARRYRFRVRDEVCPVRRHVEEYYSKLP